MSTSAAAGSCGRCKTTQKVCLREPAAPAPMTGRASPPRESCCAQTAYTVVSNYVAAVGVSGIAPLTRCRGWGRCALRCGSACAVSSDCFAAQRHTVIPSYYPRFLKCAVLQRFFIVPRWNSAPRFRGPDLACPADGGTCGHRLGWHATRAVGGSSGGRKPGGDWATSHQSLPRWERTAR